MAWVAVFLEVVEVVVKRVLVRFLVQGLEMNPASHVSAVSYTHLTLPTKA